MGISFQHILILALILLILGPKRLPELAHMLGKAYRNFKDVIDGVNEVKFRKIAEKVIEDKKENPSPPPHEKASTDEEKS